jgi:hypothetical protein
VREGLVRELELVFVSWLERPWLYEVEASCCATGIIEPTAASSPACSAMLEFAVPRSFAALRALARAWAMIGLLPCMSVARRPATVSFCSSKSRSTAVPDVPGAGAAAAGAGVTCGGGELALLPIASETAPVPGVAAGAAAGAAEGAAAGSGCAGAGAVATSTIGSFGFGVAPADGSAARG